MGISIGFNILEFADFLLRFVGIDILDDDVRKRIDYAIVDRKSNTIKIDSRNRAK